MRGILIGLSAAWLACSPAALSAQEKLVFQGPVAYEPEVPESARAECNGMAPLVERTLLPVLRERVPLEQGGEAGAGALKIRITALHNFGTQQIPTVVSIVVRGEVYHGSKLVEHNLFQRRGTTLKGGLCGAAERIGLLLGRDMAEWLPFAVQAADAKR